RLALLVARLDLRLLAGQLALALGELLGLLREVGRGAGAVPLLLLQLVELRLERRLALRHVRLLPGDFVLERAQAPALLLGVGDGLGGTPLALLELGLACGELR